MTIIIIALICKVTDSEKILDQHFQINLFSGVEYLKFLNIFENDGVALERVEATPWYYRASTPIYVDGGIPIGTTIETTAYVSKFTYCITTNLV